MNDVQSKSKIEMEVTLTITEGEARMLIEMTKYGDDAFIKGYYKILGKSYMRPYEDSIRTFFTSIKSKLPMHIRKIDNARKAFNE